MSRLLILDDDPLIATTIAMIAESADFQARTATDPETFFQLLESWQPSHIALDLIMPLLDGVQVLEQLAARGCRAGIIITSGVGNRVLDAAGRSASEHGLNIVGRLAKPFTPAALRSLLLTSAVVESAGRSPGPSSRQDEAIPQPTFAELQRALAENEFCLLYQPQISCRSGQLLGFEALARWRHPRFGLIGPGRFIGPIETAGLMQRLTDTVIEQSLDWLSSPEATALNDGRDENQLTLSINIAPHSLANEDFVENALATCRAHNIAPERIIFELTESSAMHDPIASLDQLTRLRIKGFQLSIDDFGTGYSSILQLARLPFSEIKIDRSFVMKALHSAESSVVVRSVVDLGRRLSLRTVAEGVEDDSTLDYLDSIGCEAAQGFHVGRPMPASALSDWLAGAERGQDTRHRPVEVIGTNAEVIESFRWGPGFLTGIETVDRQHKKLVDLINRLGTLVSQGQTIDSPEVAAVYTELFDYAAHHFREEERTMLKGGIDPRHVSAHQAEHANFLSELAQLRDEAGPSRSDSLEPLLGFLVNWLAYHILGIDQSMARQLEAIGNGQDARAAHNGEKNQFSNESEPLVAALSGLFRLLSRRGRALREANRNLEQQVAQRTAALSEANRQLTAIAMTDALTGLPNRRKALSILARDWASAVQREQPLTCLMIDVDHFKPVNDTYGHEAGDRVLRELARCLADAVRTDDLVARLGGDEFLVIAPATGQNGARELAERVARDVHDLQVRVAGGERWQGSVSIGGAVRAASMKTPEDLLKAADKAVYAAKQAGRNRVAMAPATD